MPNHAAESEFEFEFEPGVRPESQWSYSLDSDLDSQFAPNFDGDSGEYLFHQSESGSESELIMSLDPQSESELDQEHEPEPEPPRARRSRHRLNKYRQALTVLNQARDELVSGLADEILENSDELRAGGFILNEFLDIKGPRMQSMGLIACFLEQAADIFDEEVHAEELNESQTPRRRRKRSNPNVEPKPVDD